MSEKKKESYIKLPNIRRTVLQDVLDYLEDNDIEYIEYYEFEKDLEVENKNLQQELDKYKDNWNILKLIINEVIVTDNELYGTDLLNKMQELENKVMNKEELNNVVCQGNSDYEILDNAYEYIEKLEQENKQLQSQLQEKEKIIIIMKKYFELIYDLGFDYDGCDTKESLKNLIDELVYYSNLGRVANTTENIYTNKDKSFNILHEEIVHKEI